MFVSGTWLSLLSHWTIGRDVVRTVFRVLVQLGGLSGRPSAPRLSSDWGGQSYSCAIHRQSQCRLTSVSSGDYKQSLQDDCCSHFPCHKHREFSYGNFNRVNKVNFTLKESSCSTEISLLKCKVKHGSSRLCSALPLAQK